MAHIFGRSDRRAGSLLRHVVAAALALSVLAALPATSPASGAASGAARASRVVPLVQRVQVAHTFFGVHDASTQAYGRIDFGSLRLWDAHVTWKDIETSPGVYDWTRLDSLVSAAQAHHVEVMLVLAMTPTFYASASSLPPDDLTHYRDFVTAVMNRYRDFNGSRGIASYQVWNEGNVPTFWTGTPQQLAQLTSIVDQVRDQVDPAATVVAPSFAVRLPGQRQWFSDYLHQQVDGTPVWQMYDATALSLYPKAMYGSRPGGPEDAMHLLGVVRRQMADAGVPADKPLWATEINYGLPTGAPGHLAAQPISDQRQVANVIRTYLLGAARGLSRVYWYRYDWGLLPASMGGGTLGNTLLSDPTDHTQVTPAGLALSTAEQWLSGKLVTQAGHLRPCARDRRGTYTCVVRYAGARRTIYWNPHRQVRVPLGRGVAYSQTQQGRTVALGRTQRTIRVSYRPVMVVSPAR